MPAVTRQGDSTSGHGCFPPQSAVQGAGTVFAEGKPVFCQGMAVSAHGCPKVPPHGGNLAAGSGTVFAEGKPLGRIGDPVSCGSSMSSGAGTVFSN